MEAVTGATFTPNTQAQLYCCPGSLIPPHRRNLTEVPCPPRQVKLATELLLQDTPPNKVRTHALRQTRKSQQAQERDVLSISCSREDQGEPLSWFRVLLRPLYHSDQLRQSPGRRSNRAQVPPSSGLHLSWRWRPVGEGRGQDDGLLGIGSWQHLIPLTMLTNDTSRPQLQKTAGQDCSGSLHQG